MAQIGLFPTPIGACGLAWRGDVIIATRLPDRTPERTLRHLSSRTGGTDGEPPQAIRAAIRAMTALLEGETPDLSEIPCDMGAVDALDAAVYGATRAVPPGQTSTYGAIAAGLGDVRLARQVGQALGRNPLPILVPCHRILGADGRLVGFSASGGIETKLRMLEIEGAQVGVGPGLFGELPRATRPRR
ncbi:MAG: methylated-DNA--[protein]-cysteine S-methyltransferase [Pseudomonadota bacterium]